jgi:hypothetical protein
MNDINVPEAVEVPVLTPEMIAAAKKLLDEAPVEGSATLATEEAAEETPSEA